MYRQLILASASPRRRELLKQVGMEFLVLPAQGEEIITKVQPQEAVCELALHKAVEVAKRVSKGEWPGEKETAAPKEFLVLGADTVVAFEGKILGKPKCEAEAVEMLSSLSGRTHQVYTGVALIDVAREGWEVGQFCQETQVEMFPISEAEIRAYVESGEPMDKAGAYAIQGRGAVWIREIRGDYNNVVGLPVAEIYQWLKQLGIEISSKA